MTDTSYISPHIKQPHVVCVTDDAVIETPDPNVTSYVARGVYTFTNFKEARHFTTAINQTRDDTIAFRFSKTQENEE